VLASSAKLFVDSSIAATLLKMIAKKGLADSAFLGSDDRHVVLPIFLKISACVCPQRWL